MKVLRVSSYGSYLPWAIIDEDGRPVEVLRRIERKGDTPLIFTGAFFQLQREAQAALEGITK